jgi:hypothetical protein
MAIVAVFDLAASSGKRNTTPNEAFSFFTIKTRISPQPNDSFHDDE